MIRLLKSSEEVTEDELIEIYRMFCDSFGIVVDKITHIEPLRSYGLRDLRDQFGLDFRPYMGAKFFMTRSGRDAINIHGYSDPDHINEEQKYETFRKKLEERFGINNVVMG